MTQIKFINQNNNFLHQREIVNPGTQPKVNIQSDRDYLSNTFRINEIRYIKQSKNIELYSTLHDLEYKSDAVQEIAEDIIRASIEHGKMDITISRTGENELLIYRNSDGTFNNIIIDEDGDIEFISIPAARENTYNIHYPFIGDINIQELVSKL